jgi:hypothetical protein
MPHATVYARRNALMTFFVENTYRLMMVSEDRLEAIHSPTPTPITMRTA